MKHKKYLNIRVLVILIGVFAVLLYGCHSNESSFDNVEILRIYVDKKPVSPEGFAIQTPPLSDDIFPCTECHAYQDPNPKKRELVDMHEEISAMFNHDKENRWCTDCHDLNNRDSLRLASGKLIGFPESYKLCGQCHGDKYRDWKVGVHGKRIGEWNGKKEYFLCVHCHNPHSPKFKKIIPKPPPIRPEDIN